jgi:hypothetical protein
MLKLRTISGVLFHLTSDKMIEMTRRWDDVKDEYVEDHKNRFVTRKKVRKIFREMVNEARSQDVECRYYEEPDRESLTFSACVYSPLDNKSYGWFPPRGFHIGCMAFTRPDTAKIKKWAFEVKAKVVKKPKPKVKIRAARSGR